MNTLWMLIGVSGSGKSTWVKQQGFDNLVMIASTDQLIEEYAASQGLTYSEVFSEYIFEATARMNLAIQEAVREGKDIVWDQTNLNPRSRRHKLKMLNGYTKNAVVFKIPNEVVLAKRLANRPGKIIPENVIQSQIAALREPNVTEGFDSIIFVDNP